MRIRGIPPRGLRRRPTVLLAAGSLAVAAGLGVLSAADGRQDPGPERSVAAVAEGDDAAAVTEVDYAAAVAEAHRLVRLVRPPAGSHLLIPDAPEEGSVKIAATWKHLAMRGATWKVSLSSAQAVAWLKSYDPPSFAWRGVVLNNAPGTIASHRWLSRPPDDPEHGQLDFAHRGFSDTRPSRIWSSARLSIWLIPVQAPRQLDLYVGAEVTLRGQDPKRDDLAGPRLHVPADRPCPQELGAIGVVNPGQPELDRMLVPPGPPSGGRICFYGEYTIRSDDRGYGVGYPTRLQSELVLDQAAAARLAGIARTVRLGYLDYTGMASGLGGGPGATVLVLAYPGRPDVDLWSFNEGSAVMGNGHIRTAGPPFGDSGFSDVLDDLRLAGAPDRTANLVREPSTRFAEGDERQQP